MAYRINIVIAEPDLKNLVSANRVFSLLLPAQFPYLLRSGFDRASRVIVCYIAVVSPRYRVIIPIGDRLLQSMASLPSNAVNNRIGLVLRTTLHKDYG